MFGKGRPMCAKPIFSPKFIGDTALWVGAEIDDREDPRKTANGTSVVCRSIYDSQREHFFVVHTVCAAAGAIEEVTVGEIYEWVVIVPQP